MPTTERQFDKSSFAIVPLIAMDSEKKSKFVFFFRKATNPEVHCWQALESLYYKPSNLNNPQVHYVQLDAQERPSLPLVSKNTPI